MYTCPVCQLEHKSCEEERDMVLYCPMCDEELIENNPMNMIGVWYD